MTEHKLLYLEQGRKITSFNSICNGTYDSLQSFLKVCGILQLAVPYLNITALLRRQTSLQANVVNSTMGCRADGCNEHLEMRSCYSDMCPSTQPRQSRMTVPSECWGSNKWRHLNISTCLEASSVPFWSSSVKFFKISAGFTLTCKEIYLLCFQAHKYLTALRKALSPGITYSSKKICENNSLQAAPMTQRLWLSGCSSCLHGNASMSMWSQNTKSALCNPRQSILDAIRISKQLQEPWKIVSLGPVSHFQNNL